MLDVVVPGLQRGADLASRCTACTPPAGQLPVHRAHHDRRQRQHRRHLADRRAPRRRAARRARRCSWSRRAAAARCTRSGRRRDAAVLAYMDVDLSTDLAALLPLVAPLISGHSDLAIGTRLAPRLPGRARRQARDHLALLQPDPARHAAPPRFSDAQCGFKAIRADVAAAAAAAGRGHRLVLRHRAAGAGRARAGCASTRCRSTGSTTRTAGSTSCDAPRTTCRGIAAAGARALPTGALPVHDAAAAARPGRARSAAPGRAHRHDQRSSCGSPRSASSARWPTWCCSSLLAAGAGAQAANLLALLRHRRRQHRRQPPADLRRARSRGRVVRHQFQGLVVFGAGPGHHQRLAGPAAPIAAPSPPSPVEVVELARPGAICSPTVVRFVLLRGWVFHPRRAH